MMDARSEKGATSEEAPAMRFNLIELARLREDRNQPRGVFSERALRELAESLRQCGQLTPLLVRPDGEDFIILAGHRRRRAAKRAGFQALWCAVTELDPEGNARRQQLHETIHQQRLKPLELAFALWRLKQESGETNAALARMLAKSDSWVSQQLGVVDPIGVVELEPVTVGDLDI